MDNIQTPEPATAAPAQIPIARGAPSAEVSAELDRFDIAVVLQAAYEWGGYRYSNASDAIAAARRSGTSGGSR